MRVEQQGEALPEETRGALQRIVEQLDVDLVDVQHRIILVTGAATGDGVSTITQWLLLLLAGTREGDLLYVNASTQAEINDDSAVVTTQELSQHVRPTLVPSVYSLEVRNTSSGVGPGLHDIARALADLRGRFTWIVIDAPPPSCFSPRSAFLVQQADGVLVVLEANRTDRDHAKNTVELIRQSGGRVIGALLNKSKT